MKRTLLVYRLSLGLFVAGLILSGLTAFAVQPELSLLCRWIAFVFFGLKKTYGAFPFVAYGTDWLAFGHLIIAFSSSGRCAIRSATPGCCALE